MHPMLSSLRHHKLTTLLLVLQVTLTAGIVCNVASLISSRMHEVSSLTGVQEAGLSVLDVEDVAPGVDPTSRHTEDLALLRVLPGVQAVAAVANSLPLSDSSYNTSACDNQVDEKHMEESYSDNMPGCSQTSIYQGGPSELSVLGLQLVEGRDFKPEEYVRLDSDPFGQVPAVILSRDLAERIYPGQDALGKSIDVNDKPSMVVGVVDKLLRPNLGGDPGEEYHTLLQPVLQTRASLSYILRSDPKDQAEVLREAQAVLLKAEPQRIIRSARSYTEMRRDYFQRDFTMIGLLLASALGLLLVTAIGIAGLAGFWVQQRTRQIGIRRAIGATRRDVLRHFQMENFLIVGTGVVLGLVLAELLNMLLVRSYGVDPLPVLYLPVTALLLVALGQLAVLSPALHASRIPPASATRNI